MSAKVFIQSVDRRTIEKSKRSKAESLVRQLLAIRVSRYLYRRLQIKPCGERTEQTVITPRIPKAYQHHLEPKLCRVNRREMEELERYQALGM